MNSSYPCLIMMAKGRKQRHYTLQRAQERLGWLWPGRALLRSHGSAGLACLSCKDGENVPTSNVRLYSKASATAAYKKIIKPRQGLL